MRTKKNIWLLLLLFAFLLGWGQSVYAIERNSGNFLIVQDTLKEKNDFRMRINRGRRVTGRRDVLVEFRTLNISPALVAKMKVGFRADLRDAGWETFDVKYDVQLPGGNGLKTIYAQLMDRAGNVSAVQNAKIIFDTTPPEDCAVRIDEGAKYTNSKLLKVALELRAKNAYKMKISNSTDFSASPWLKYQDKYSWKLAAGSDGPRTVYVLFSDVVNNEAAVVAATINVDITPPKGTVVINNNQQYTNKHTVELEIHATDDDVEQTRIIFGNDSHTAEYDKAKMGDKPFIYNLPLDSIDGKKTVQVYFRDHAGNISTDRIFDQIVLDSSPPEKPYLAINQGKRFTTNKDALVDLLIRTRETPTGITMRLSNSEDFKNHEDFAYSPTISGWQLDDSDDGFKTVYLKFIDAAGNHSEVAKASVALDRSVPVASKLVINNNDKWSKSNSVTLKIEANGADMMQFSNTEDFKVATNWMAFKADYPDFKLPGGEGEKQIYARFKDAAGNKSNVVGDKIMVDTKPPSGRLVIERGEEVTTNKDKKVTLFMLLSSDATEMIVSHNADFKGASWQPFAQEVNNWELIGEDGPKTIYAQFRDDAGHLSPIVKDDITLDTSPPRNLKLMIDNGKEFTTNREKKVMLKLRADDAVAMRVSFQKREVDSAAWESYKPVSEIILDGEDGLKEVYVQFMDKNKNLSDVVSGRVYLDRTPPEPKLFEIDEGAEWTNNKEKKVAIRINAEDAFRMKISADPELKNGKWRPYTKAISEFVLPGEDGEKKLYIIFSDKAGNVSRTLSASIKLKRKF